MKKSLLIKLCILIAIIILMSVVPATAFAKVPTAKWTINAERTEITDGNTVYYAYDMPGKYYYLTEWKTRVLQQGSMLKVGAISYADDDSIIFSRKKDKYYATTRAHEKLNMYFSGEKGEYYLNYKNKWGAGHDDKIIGLNARYATGDKTTFNVKNIKFNDRFLYVDFVDETHTFRKVTGLFFMINDRLYYIDLEQLPKEMRDEYGYLYTAEEGTVGLLEIVGREKEDYFAIRTNLPMFT